MPIFAAQMSLKMVTNVPADVSVNTLYFEGTNTPLALAAIPPLVEAFYDDISTILSGDVAGSGHSLKIYDLSDPQPRYPAVDQVFNFPGAPAGASMPHENAICMSFQGVRISGTPQARRRGRIYIGPCDASLVLAGGYVTTGGTSVIALAGATLLTAALADPDVDWVVYSPTSGTGTIIDNGWVDNNWDTQRRRGRLATARDIF